MLTTKEALARLVANDARNVRDVLTRTPPDAARRFLLSQVIADCAEHLMEAVDSRDKESERAAWGNLRMALKEWAC